MCGRYFKSKATADLLSCFDAARSETIQYLLESLPEPVLTPRIVSTRVNSVRNDGSELIEPAA